MKKLPLAVLLLTLYAGISGCNDRPDRQSLQNIEAFARMYGLVRVLSDGSIRRTRRSGSTGTDSRCTE